MKKIALNHGLFCTVDDDWFDMLSSIKWGIKEKRYPYPRASGLDPLTRKHVLERIHRVIMGALSGEIVDHIDGNPFNNTSANLRICTFSENCQNSKAYASSKLKGVYKGDGKRNKPWRVKIGQKTIGHYYTKKEASDAYDIAIKNIHGKFARLNLVPPDTADAWGAL